MIIEALLDLLKLIIDGILGLRPEWNMSLPSGVTQLVGLLKQFDTVLPVSETFICLGAYVTLIGGMNVWKWAIKVVDWIADVIP